MTVAQKYYPPMDPSIPQNVALHLRMLYEAANNHDQAITTLNAKVPAASSSTTSTTTSSTSTVTAAQAQTIAKAAIAAQFPAQLQLNLGKVNNQTGTAYTVQQSDYGGIVTLNNAGAVAVTLNNGLSTTVSPFWWAALENLGVGTATLTPVSGTINVAANITLATNQGAIVYFDGTNWWALTSTTGAGAGVTSLNALTGALSLTSTGATVTITASGSTINLEVAGAGGLPVNDPTFTGVLTGPECAIDNMMTHGTTPTLAFSGPGGGAGATASIGGSNTFGQIALTAGTGSAAGLIMRVTLSASFGTHLRVVVWGFDGAAGLAPMTLAGFEFSASVFDIDTGVALTAGHNYTINYLVFGF